MSEDIAFTDEEIGELIEFLRKEGLDPCDDAADLIESQAAELSALRERVRELEGVIQSYIKAQGECDEDSDNFHGEIDALIDSFKAMQRSVSEKALLSTRREEG